MIFVKFLLNINHRVWTTTWGLMNHHDWIHDELLFKCVRIDVDHRVGVKVWLNDLYLLKRWLKEPDNTEWTSIHVVAKESCYELLGKWGHLGLGLGRLAWNCLFTHTHIYLVHHLLQFFLPCIYIFGFIRPLNTRKSHHPFGVAARMKNWFLFFSIFSFFLRFSSHAFCFVFTFSDFLFGLGVLRFSRGVLGSDALLALNPWGR